AELEAGIALAATAPPQLLHGDTAELLPEAFARVPAGALPVVITTWALSSLPPQSRLRFLHRLRAAAAGRTMGWGAGEGAGVGPGLCVGGGGGGPGCGQSMIGLAVPGQPTLRAEAAGRCWSRGRFLSWLADS